MEPTQRLTRTELIEIRKRHHVAHYASPSGDGVTLDLHICDYCGGTWNRPWPCDASRLLDEIDELRKFYPYP